MNNPNENPTVVTREQVWEMAQGGDRQIVIEILELCDRLPPHIKYFLARALYSENKDYIQGLFQPKDSDADIGSSDASS